MNRTLQHHHKIETQITDTSDNIAI